MHKMGQMKLDVLERFATSFRADFRFAPLNIMILVVLCFLGLVVHLAVVPFSLEAVISMIGVAIVLATVFRLFQVWESVVIATTGAALYVYLQHRPDAWILVTSVVVAGLVSPCIQMAYQWEKAVVLRFGRFRGLKGSGLFLIFPVIDKVANYVDQRIRVTDFKAETTLTRDTVPVNVDAIAFWMVWDAQKAVLEVEDFESAVTLSAQTGLRDAIGRHELGDMLSHRDRLGKEIQQVLDAKTNAWGITVQSVEIRDIIIPKELEDAMSRQAQAERERQSRIILSKAEEEIAESFERASEHYRRNQAALHLRAMNMVFEGLKKKGSMIIVPSTAVETMGLGAMGGLTAFDRILESGDRMSDEAPTSLESEGDSGEV
ncbi:MAG: slipin family protein [Acidobacteria bacterium]|jgi:regulator of protease activity HflC (stomatin/prohibitin superfamily)|nr:slipin family protein [Acidobacteriota bacterium]